MLLDVINPATALEPEDALVALHERAEMHDLTVEVEHLSDNVLDQAYRVIVRRRDSRRTVVAGRSARRGCLGIAIRDVLTVMP